ncbi:MAG TPA: MFS transporter [Rhizomicrobium sp.]|jgi:EmrB/QacA subfamily drug resistance transporter|nr:MFS transporter [Rhizomicrobium sp.]
MRIGVLGWVLVTTMLASSLAFIDSTVVNVGLSAIGKDFHSSAGGLQWVVNGYLLPLGALLLLGGAAGDRFGRRRLLIGGTGLFAVASLICAMAPSLTWLLAGRGLQGIGSALLMPNSLAILGSSFSGEAKGRAVGIWASVTAAAGAIGPVLGGWLIDTAGWRAIFLINLAPALAAIALALRFVRDDPSDQDGVKLDLLGGALATLGLGLLTWGLTVGNGPGGWSSTALLLLAAGIVLLASFVLVEKRRGSRAMMPLALFGSKSFVALTLLTLLLYGALGALLVLMPYVLIRAFAFTGTEAGLSILPFAAVVALASPKMGALAGRIGTRLPLTLGPLAVAAGFLLLLRMTPGTGYWSSVFPAILMIAIGMTGAVAPLTTAVLSSVDRAHTGSASGFNSAAARVAGMVATALLGGVLAESGAALIGGFRLTALACAAACVAASASIFFLDKALRR